jgi:hypothetical protein
VSPSSFKRLFLDHRAPGDPGITADRIMRTLRLSKVQVTALGEVVHSAVIGVPIDSEEAA